MTSNVYHSLRVPGSVFAELKRRFASLSPAEDVAFLAKYRDAYGESALRYLVKTYRRARVDGQYLLGAMPSGQTLERILQLVPTVMSTEERFSLFEQIINYNESCDGFDPHIAGGAAEPNKNFSFSYEDWTYRGELCVISAIENLGQSTVSKINYLEKYDFSDIGWLLDKDISAFCQLLQNAKIVKIQSKIAAAKGDVLLLRQKWYDLEKGKVSDARHSELSYRFSLSGSSVSVVIYDAKERARSEAKKKLSEAAEKFGCLTIIVIIILLAIFEK